MSTIIRPSDVFKNDGYKSGYADGYADGSLSVTEEIINEKVVKYLEERIMVIKARGIVKSNEIDVLKELIKHFKGEKK